MRLIASSTFPRWAKGGKPLRPRWLALWLCGAIAACAADDSADQLLSRGAYREARERLEPLAARGDAAAQNRLGVLHYLGLGTPVDRTRAADWFKRAALAGHADAQRNLGSMFRQGLGVPRDELRAFGWYDAARRGGNPRAEGYMRWMAQFVGWNQQAYARRIVADDLRQGSVSECGEGLLMSACPPAPRGATTDERPENNP
jgi:TPR repeat protein